MNDINSVFSVLDAINKENTISLYVPSLKREVKFKSITTGQQKLILKAAVDNPIFQSRFVAAAYSIITENCTEKEILNQLTTIDSLSILLQYRINGYGTEYSTELDGVEYKINLATFKERVLQINIPESTVFTLDSFIIKVGAPTLFEQYQLERELREKRTEDTTINESLGEAFMGEVSKFIKEISIVIDGKPQDINYKNLTFGKKYQVLEKLPASVVRGIITYLEDVAEQQRKVTRFEGIDKDGTVRAVDITIDASMFSIS
jgi:hypothetical protein